MIIKKKIKELNVFLKDCFKTRYPSLLSLQSKIARTHPIKPKRGESLEKSLGIEADFTTLNFGS